MQYLKRNTRFSILTFLIIILYITISISTLAKTEVYFSLSDNPQKAIIKNINQAEAFINIAMYVFTDKEIALPLINAHILLTGSYNWTFSANNRNDENLMVIDDPEIIKIFQNQFVNLWTNKYNPERTKELFNKAKVNILTIFPPPAQTKTKIININTASQDELIKVLQISEPLAQKIITLRDSLSGGFKEQKDLLQLPELTNLDWREWEEEGIIINVE